MVRIRVLNLGLNYEMCTIGHISRRVMYYFSYGEMLVHNVVGARYFHEMLTVSRNRKSLFFTLNEIRKETRLADNF